MPALRKRPAGSVPAGLLVESCGLTSEGQTQTELKHACGLRTGNRPKGARSRSGSRNRGSGVVQVRMVKYVETLGTEFQFEALAEAKVTRERHIHLHQARPRQEVTRSISLHRVPNDCEDPRGTRSAARTRRNT